MLVSHQSFMVMVAGKDRRPIVEFAIENVKMLKKRASQLTRQPAAARGDRQKGKPLA